MHNGMHSHGATLIDQALDKGLDRLWFAQPLEDRFLADQSRQRLRTMEVKLSRFTCSAPGVLSPILRLCVAGQALSGTSLLITPCDDLLYKLS